MNVGKQALFVSPAVEVVGWWELENIRFRTQNGRMERIETAEGAKGVLFP